MEIKSVHEVFHHCFTLFDIYTKKVKKNGFVECSRSLRETGYYTGSEGQFLCAEDFRALSVPLKVKAEQQGLKHIDETSLSPASPITPPTHPLSPLASPAGILHFHQISFGLISDHVFVSFALDLWFSCGFIYILVSLCWR